MSIQQIKKIETEVVKKRLWLIIFLGLSVVFFIDLKDFLPFLSSLTTLRAVGLILLALTSSIIFILIRTYIWQRSTKVTGSNQSDYSEACRQILKSDFIGLVTFPGKIWSDGYKFFILRQAGHPKPLAAIAIFRLSLSFGSLWILSLTLITDGNIYLISGLIALFLIGIYLFTRRQSQNTSVIKKRDWLLIYGLPSLKLSLFALLGTSVLFIQLILVAKIFYLEPSLSLFSIFAFVYILSAIANIPLGIGVSEISYLVYLSPSLPTSQIIIIVSLLRLTGPVLSAILGWLILLRDRMKVISIEPVC